MKYFQSLRINTIVSHRMMNISYHHRDNSIRMKSSTSLGNPIKPMCFLELESTHLVPTLVCRVWLI